MEDDHRDNMEVRTGVAALDELLGGGFGGYGSEHGGSSALAGVAGGGRVIEVSGDGGSGKTVRFYSCYSYRLPQWAHHAYPLLLAPSALDRRLHYTLFSVT